MKNEMRGFFEPVAGLAVFLIFSGIAILLNEDHPADDAEITAHSDRYENNIATTRNQEIFTDIDE